MQLTQYKLEFRISTKNHFEFTACYIYRIHHRTNVINSPVTEIIISSLISIISLPLCIATMHVYLPASLILTAVMVNVEEVAFGNSEFCTIFISCHQLKLRTVISQILFDLLIHCMIVTHSSCHAINSYIPRSKTSFE